MAIKKKPDVDNFINSGSIKTNDNTTNENTEKIDGSSENIKNVINSTKNQGSKKRLTIYLDEERYQKWKKYEYNQILKGEKVSFQGKILEMLDNILE